MPRGNHLTAVAVVLQCVYIDYYIILAQTPRRKDCRFLYFDDMQPRSRITTLRDIICLQRFNDRH